MNKNDRQDFKITEEEYMCVLMERIHKMYRLQRIPVPHLIDNIYEEWLRQQEKEFEEFIPN